MSDTFSDRLNQRYKKTRSLLCIGLDPQKDDLVSHHGFKPTLSGKIAHYIQKIIDATKDYALAYKANVAYFEQFGLDGYITLKGLRNQIPEDIPLILDSNRCDIGVSAEAYATSLYDKLHADAVTVNGYMGSDSISPFTDRPCKGVFIVCKSSNPSSCEIQNLILSTGEPLYMHQAELAKSWNENYNVGLVVGATYPQELAAIREKCPNMWILSPGIGVQGGDLEETIKAGLTPFGGLLINIGRGISGTDNWRDTAKKYVDDMRVLIKNLAI